MKREELVKGQLLVAKIVGVRSDLEKIKGAVASIQFEIKGKTYLVRVPVELYESFQSQYVDHMEAKLAAAEKDLDEL